MKSLHHKKHTPAKRFLSLLCILALCLGLLPVTAEAAEGAPSSLYVGNQQVISSSDITYWTTDKSTGGLTKYEGNDDNWNVKYDPSTATLTLSGATIKGGSDVVSIPYGSGIYAQGSSNQPVTLTIELIGENTITGTFGIYVKATPPATPGTDASLVIKKSGDNGDNGSLTVTGTSSSGLHIASGTGNASLTIKNVSVVANATSSYSGSGVCVQSGASATDSPQLSLSVDGGSLTASGGGNNDGIQFYVGALEANSATTSLTVTDHAIVDARNGGISASGISETLPTPKPTGDNRSGIVFNDKNGTVYGSVALQDDLTIGAGETLTVPSGSSLNCNGKLTNNGTILASGGTVTGSLSGGSTVTTPNITVQPSDNTVTEGQGATFTVEASAGSETLTYQWQQSTDNGSSWTNIESETNASYTINSTNTSMNGYQYRCVVTGSGGVSVISKTATLTVQAKPAPVSVTGVSLDKATLELYTGDTATLTATVEPDNATNKAVTWESSDTTVATVQDGTVTAVKAGEATITATTQDGGKTDTCTVTVTDKTYKISADTTAIDFGSAYTGYAQPAAQTVTITNDGNQPLTLTQPASTNRFEVGTLSKTALAAGETATFTVQPKAGLSAGTYSDTIAVTGNGGATLSITASFTVKSQPSYNPPTVSEKTIDAIADAQPGETVTVDLSHGSTKLDKEVFETLAGKDITLDIDLGDGLSWTVNGMDIPEDADFVDIDLGVTMDSDGIPVNVINTITGEVGTVQITLAHDGEFGFTMTLTAPLGKENAGYWANLYHYKVNGGEADREDPLGDDEDAEALNFEAAAKIDEDGSVTIPFSHASQYAIVIDTHSHATVDVSDLFIDVARDAWYKDAVQYAYDHGLMTGVSDTEFAPEATTTRAMIVSILARLEGVTTAEAAGFADVNDNDWYATAVNWAANVGVVNGYEDNTFQPNTAITREQLAAILMNYAAYKGEDVSNRADLTSYTDQPSTWAEEAMQWAVAEGLISGVTNDQLQPQGNATRAQVAAILQRFLEA